MSHSFGIDHPLIAVSDINALRDRLIALGFNMTPLGRHPWGTSTSLAMFDRCLIEIMGIYDDRLLDEKPAGDFRFGRHVHSHLGKREGVALTALHSTDIQADIARAEAAGLSVSGTLEFSREVTLPDGRKDHTRTTLALMPDREFPRLSFFLCQQHRPELIYVPEWLQHPNGVDGIAGISVLAEPRDQPRLRERLTRLYGEVQPIDGGFAVQTANGQIRVQDSAAATRELGPLPGPSLTESGPAIIAMSFACPDLSSMRGWIAAAGLEATERGGALILSRPDLTGNTVLRFVPKSYQTTAPGQRSNNQQQGD